MTFAELCTFVDLNRHKIEPDTIVGVSNHFGELEDTLIGLEPRYKNGKPMFVGLVGVSSMYPEPD